MSNNDFEIEYTADGRYVVSATSDEAPECPDITLTKVSLNGVDISYVVFEWAPELYDRLSDAVGEIDAEEHA